MSKTTAKTLLLLTAMFSLNLQAENTITVVETGYGSGDTLESASSAALSKAEQNAILKQPKFIYTDTTLTNASAKHRLVSIPAQVKNIKLIDVSFEKTLAAKQQKNITINEALEKKDGSINGYGDPIGTTYYARAKFEMELIPASEIDRAKYMAEYEAMKEALSTGGVPNKPTKQSYSYKDTIEVMARTKEITEQKSTDTLISTEAINESVEFYRANYLNALVNTYGEVNVSVESHQKAPINKWDKEWKVTHQTISVTFGEVVDYAKKCNGDQPYRNAGNLCDLYYGLPIQVRDTIETLGINGQNDIRDDRDVLFDPLRRVRVMPVVSNTNETPIHHAMLLSKGAAASAYRNVLAADAYAATTLKTVPYFIARAILEKPPIYLSLYLKNEGKKIDIPLTGDSYLLGGRISVTIPAEKLTTMLTADTVEVSLWNSSNKRIDGKWKNFDEKLVVSTLPARLTANIYSRFLESLKSYSTNNMETITKGDFFQLEKTYSSPASYLGCLFKDQKMLPCDDEPSVSIYVGVKHNKSKIGAVNYDTEKLEISGGAQQSSGCYMYSYSAGGLDACGDVVQEGWLLSLGRKDLVKARNYPLQDILLLQKKYGKHATTIKSSSTPAFFW